MFFTWPIIKHPRMQPLTVYQHDQRAPYRCVGIPTKKTGEDTTFQNHPTAITSEITQIFRIIILPSEPSYSDNKSGFIGGSTKNKAYHQWEFFKNRRIVHCMDRRWNIYHFQTSYRHRTEAEMVIMKYKNTINWKYPLSLARMAALSMLFMDEPHHNCTDFVQNSFFYGLGRKIDISFSRSCLWF